MSISSIVIMNSSRSGSVSVSSSIVSTAIIVVVFSIAGV